MTDTSVNNEVWEFVQEMNRLWTEEDRADELVHYFHKDMVAIVPSDKLRIEGQMACVAGWKEFTQMAKIHYWKVVEPDVRVFGSGLFAVVTYYYEMSCDMGGQTIQLNGRDMLSLVKEESKWWVVSDQFSQMPK